MTQALVRDYLPLQQGLRPRVNPPPWAWSFCQRLSSITTRIKTKLRKNHTRGCVYVRDYLPLQQGLRRRSIPRQKVEDEVRDYLPLQQGLRHRVAIFIGAANRKSETIFHYNKD